MIQKASILYDTKKLYRGWMLDSPILEHRALEGLPNSESESDTALVIGMFQGSPNRCLHGYFKSAIWLIWDFMNATDLVERQIPFYVVYEKGVAREIEPYFQVAGFENYICCEEKVFDGFEWHNKRWQMLRIPELEKYDKLILMDSSYIWHKTKLVDAEKYPFFQMLSEEWNTDFTGVTQTNHNPMENLQLRIPGVSDREFWEQITKADGFNDIEVSKIYWSMEDTQQVAGGIFGVTPAFLANHADTIAQLSTVMYSDEPILSVLLKDTEIYPLPVQWQGVDRWGQDGVDICFSVPPSIANTDTEAVIEYRKRCYESLLCEPSG